MFSVHMKIAEASYFPLKSLLVKFRRAVGEDVSAEGRRISSRANAELLGDGKSLILSRLSFFCPRLLHFGGSDGFTAESVRNTTTVRRAGNSGTILQRLVSRAPSFPFSLKLILSLQRSHNQ